MIRGLFHFDVPVTDRGAGGVLAVRPGHRGVGTGEAEEGDTGRVGVIESFMILPLLASRQ